MSCPGSSGAAAPDPIVTDGDKYRLVLENDRVRVLRYRDKPGDKTHPHHHDAFVLYALSSFRRRLIFPDGNMKERDFKPGDAIWMPEQVHTGENVGTTDTDVVIVEQKSRCSSPRPIGPPRGGPLSESTPSSRNRPRLEPNTRQPTLASQNDRRVGG